MWSRADTPKKFKVESTASSITVSWDKQFANSSSKDDIESYAIKYKESGTKSFTTKPLACDQDKLTIDGLKSGTLYNINVFICNDLGDSTNLFRTEYRTVDSKANFLMEQARPDRTKTPALYYLEPVFTDTQKVPKDKTSKDDDGVDQIRVCDMIAKRNTSMHSTQEKTLLLLGATGTGKSTLIDALVNFITGVSYKDDHRFLLISKTDEEEKRANKQSQSQTSSVTVYRIPRMEGLRIPCGVNIIDTPGFNDTRKNFDKRITAQIKELFEKKIDHLDAILIVVPMSTTRLTEGQQNVFTNILQMFGDDIKNNVFVATTWDDSGEITCLDVLKSAGVHYADVFRFNNANLYSAFSSAIQHDTINQSFWDARTKSFSELFQKLEATKPTTVQSSKEVMRARHSLEIQLVALEDTLSREAQDIVNYKQDKEVLDAIEKETPENRKKSVYRRVVPEMQLRYTGNSSLNCDRCEKTCHENCWVLFDTFKWTCEAMESDQCTVCVGKCTASSHEFSKYRYEQQYVVQIFSGQEVVERQTKREASFEGLKNTLRLIKKLIEEINTKALQKDALSVAQYIENLAKKEEKERKQGYEMRAQIQKKIVEYLKKDVSILKLSMNYLISN